MFYIVSIFFSLSCVTVLPSSTLSVHYGAFRNFIILKSFQTAVIKDSGDKGRVGNTEEKYNNFIFWGQSSSRPTSTTLSVTNYVIMCMVSCNLYFQRHERLNSSRIFTIHVSVTACVINHRYTISFNEKELSVVTFAVAVVVFKSVTLFDLASGNYYICLFLIYLFGLIYPNLVILRIKRI